MALDDEETDDDEELDLDLSAGTLDKTNDPVRLYLREMGVVPLLHAKAKLLSLKESNADKSKRKNHFPRSPIAVEARIKIGEDLKTTN